MEEKLVLLPTQVNSKKEMLAKISKCLCQNLVIGVQRTNQSCVQQSRNPCNYRKVYYFIFKFLDSQHKISIVLWLLNLQNLKMNYKQLRLVSLHHVNTECT